MVLMEIQYSSPASFGKEQAYIARAELLQRGFDTYKILKIRKVLKTSDIGKYELSGVGIG